MSVAIAPQTDAGSQVQVGPGADPAWVDACVECFGLEPAFAEVDGALAPFVYGAGGRFELAGPGQLFEPADVTWRDSPARARLFDSIAESGRPLALLRLPADSPTVAEIRARYPVVLLRPAGACPFIELADEPEALLPKRRREDLRRAARRAERLGGASLVVHEPSADEVDGLFEIAVSIEAESWKGRSGTALVSDVRRAAFYRRYARLAAEAGELRVALLRIDGEAAAMQLAVERDEGFWLLKIGYDERFADASPGQLLMLETLRWSAGRGLARYEFLGQSAPWTQAWTRLERQCAAVYAYPASPRGGFHLARDAARRVMRGRG